MQPTRPCDYSTRKKKGTVEKEKHTSPAIPSVFFFFSFFIFSKWSKMDMFSSWK